MGFHTPTVAFPEPLGIMIEPTESYSKEELDTFADTLISMIKFTEEYPNILLTVPHLTPVGKINEVEANRKIIITEKLKKLPILPENKEIVDSSIDDIKQKILKVHNNYIKEKKMKKDTIKVTITGAAGQISYSLLFRIASGEVFWKRSEITSFFIRITYCHGYVKRSSYGNRGLCFSISKKINYYK